jgi:hypothetical protein
MNSSKIETAILLWLLLAFTGCASQRYLKTPDRDAKVQAKLRTITMATVVLRDGTQMTNTPIEMRIPGSITVRKDGYPQSITFDAIAKISFQDPDDIYQGAALGANPGLFITIGVLSAFGAGFPGILLAGGAGLGLLVTGASAGGLIGALATHELVLHEVPSPVQDNRKKLFLGLKYEVESLHEGDRIHILYLNGEATDHIFASYKKGADHFVVDPGVFSWRPIRFDKVKSIERVP